MLTNTAVADMETETKKRNSSSVGDQIRSYFRHPGSGILALLTGLAAFLTFADLPLSLPLQCFSFWLDIFW